MILKAKHLYRAELKSHINGKKRYVLTFPIEDIDVSNPMGYYDIKSFAHIDILGFYNEHSSIGFGSSFTFKEPTISDVFEIVEQMRKRKNYRYNLRTKEIEKIK